VILLLTVLFDVIQSFIFGNLMDILWDAWDFFSAPFIFFTMLFIGNFIYKRWLSSAEWETLMCI
jgi:hypothetical protein